MKDYAFPSRTEHATHISTRQYARLVHEGVTEIAFLSEDYGTHSLRRTKAFIIYQAAGHLRALQIMRGYTKIEKHGQISGWMLRAPIGRVTEI
ncbi:hypothetical protein EP837_02940 [Sphingobium sp. EP60837]|nr:hypothetical protein EP837_02940 [Sphingobium sp. EP60837]